MNTFLENLNEAQYAAVTAPLGTQMIVAGAGSGKTRVITSRIAYLLSHHHIPASAIVALTFTNKAGNEMKERIQKYLPDTPLPFVGTFHSYCVKFLKRHRHVLPFSDFSIIDTEDQRALIKRLLEAYGAEKQTTPAKMQSFISLHKNKLPGAAEHDVPPAAFFKEVMAAYEKEKHRSHLFDFDDLLLVTLDVLKKHPDIAKKHQAAVRHILVDEYQDTNDIQHELLKCLATDEKGACVIDSLCAVGDQDQSIYSWRGAQVHNMQQFCSDFAPVNIVTIEQNYRSVKPILDAANGVIRHNGNRLEKKLWSAKSASQRMLHLQCHTGEQEAHAIASLLQLARKKFPLSAMAILYRTHNQSRTLEEALMLLGIPYTIVGGIRFYERKEIKDILAYAKLIINPHDRQSFLRIINTPARGIGEKALDYLLSLWQEHETWHARTLLSQSIQSDVLSRAQKMALEKVHTLLTPEQHVTASHALIEKIIHTTEYASYLRKEYSEQELANRLDNIKELVSAAQAFEREHPESSIADFLEHILLMQDQGAADEKAAERVKLMTLHGAKGLEFDLVVLCGLEEQLFPSARATQSRSELEEERRLMYVGLTRAREYVLLTSAALRTTYGTSTHQEPSRFLKEIPAELINTHDTRYESTPLRSRTLALWLNIAPPAVPTTYGTNNTATNSPFNPFGGMKVKRPEAPAKQAVSHAQAPWLARMPVKHPTFGVGLIQEVEKRGDGEYFLTISFKCGVKKISSRFVVRS